MKERDRQPDTQESREAVAVTVAWMLACTSTAVAMFVVLALRFLIIAFPTAAGQVHPLGRISGVLLFVAMITGLMCVGLTPLAHRIRKIAPPRAITMGAVMIGLSPIALLVVLLVAGP